MTMKRIEIDIPEKEGNQMPGNRKLDLIALYGRMGLPYLDSSEEELEEDLSTLRNIRKAAL